MVRFWSLVMFLFLLQLTPAQAKVTEYVRDASLDLSAGYRVDQLDWNIAGTISGTNPNIISELTWSDLEIYQLQLDGQIEVGSRRQSK